jgi:hypothetical protein
VAGNRKAPTGIVALALAVFVVWVSGCGGGGDGETTTAASVPTVPQVTSPAPAGPDQGSTTTTRTAPGQGSPAPGGGQGALGSQSFEGALAPFRDCLAKKGVTLPLLRGSGAGPPPRQNSAQYRDQVEKAFTCIPELPPQFQERAEQLKRRFQQRQG